jgi:hypothetical protein
MNMMQPSNAIMKWATTAGLPYPGKGGKRKTHRRKSIKHRKTKRRHHRK